MAITSKNQRLIAYKKLLAKSHTSAQKGDATEEYASNVQMSTQEVFLDDPTQTTDPERPIVSSNSTLTHKVTFLLEAIPASEYQVNSADGDGENDGGAAQLAGVHAWRLKFPSNTTIDTTLGQVNFSNKYLTESLKYQLVSEKYGSIYRPVVKNTNGDTLYASGRQEWILDYYSGILFMQDLNDGEVPATVDAYFYTGKYVSDVLQSDSSTGVTNLNIDGTLTTRELVVERTTNVVTETNHIGSATFGDGDDTFTFNGTVNINGTLNGISGLNGRSILAINATTTLSEANGNIDYGVYKITAASATIDITLPSAADVAEREYVFKRMDSTSQVVSVKPIAGQYIDGFDHTVGINLHTQYESVTLISDGSNWIII